MSRSLAFVAGAGRRLALASAAASVLVMTATGAAVAQQQERMPWQSGQPSDGYSQPNQGYGSTPSSGYGSGGASGGYSGQPAPGSSRADDAYRAPAQGYGGTAQGYGAGSSSGYGAPAGRADDAYRPPSTATYDSYRPSAGPDNGGGYYDDRYRRGDPPPPPPPPYVDNYRRGGDAYDSRGPGEPYAPPREAGNEPYDRNYGGTYRDEGPRYADEERGTYSQNEIIAAGHSFFGSVSSGLASVIEYAFKRSGRPNGYILGEDAGGAFVAGLRYGEGMLNTKDAGRHKVYWQGPSVGYDFGAEGSKTMVLVYNLRDPSDIYNRFGGVQGSAYVVGGVGIQFQKYGDIVLAPIRSGVGLRLGANVGYLKYTRHPTWNPF